MDDFNVQINDRIVNQNKFSGLKKFFLSPKIIFIILGIVVLVEVVYGIRALSKPLPPPPSQPGTQAVAANIAKTPGKIYLESAKKTFNVKEVVPVIVMIDAGSYAVSGTDLIIHFDPQILQVNGNDISKGNIFEEYLAVSADAKNGIVAISGVNNDLQKSAKGIGQFAAINFKAKMPGQTNITIDFIQKDSTIDSNLMDSASSKDILESVGNLGIKIE